MPSALKVDQLGGANFGNYHLRNVASLHVGGSALATAILDVSGSKTADAGSAIGQNNTTTLVAAANNDILTAIRIAPTFTNGAFTGVVNKALWVVSGLTDLDGDLEVAGTADITGATTLGTLSAAATTITGVFTHNASVTATSGAARSMVLTPTLTAAANNDTLTAVRIAPTFTPGAFTGVTSVALEVTAGRTTLQTLTTAGLITANAGVTLGTSQKLTFGDGSFLDTAPVSVDEAANYAWTGTHTWSAQGAFNGGVTMAGAFGAGVHTASKGGWDFSSGYSRLWSWGADTVTYGAFELRQTVSDGSATRVPLKIDSAGNYGVKDKTPSATHTALWQLQSSWSTIVFHTTAGYTHIAANAEVDATGNWDYQNTAAAARLSAANGEVDLSVAASGTGGTAITWTQAIRIQNAVAGSNQGIIMDSVQIYPRVDNAIRLGTNGNRYSELWAANGTIQTSARHLKNLGSTLTTEEGMAAIATLPIYEYTRKNDEAKLRYFGPVLDEMPEYMRPNEDGETWVEGNLLAFNTLAIQDLNKRVSALEMLAA